MKWKLLIFKIILISVLFTFWSCPVTASTTDHVIRGTISMTSGPDSTITINTSTDLITGQVPKGETNYYSSVFYSFSNGDPVVAVGSEDPDMKWITLAKLSNSASGQEFVSRIVGDPTKMPIPLIENYSVNITIIPNCSRCEGSICKAAYANTTLMKSGRIVKQVDLISLQDYDRGPKNIPRTGFLYKYDNSSSIQIDFIDGENDAGICTGIVKNQSNAIQNFDIQVNPPPGMTPGTVTVMYYPPSGFLSWILQIILIIGFCVVVIISVLYTVKNVIKKREKE
jgi:hypothetical protein